MVGDMVTHTRFRGPAQMTASGHPFYVLTPRVEDFRVDDIAAQLAREPRWGGALRDHIDNYYVAQHSVYVSIMVRAHDFYLETSRENQILIEKYALFHDGEEFVGKDIVKPMKVALKGNYEPVMDKIRSVLFESIGLYPSPPAAFWKVVKWADKRVCAAERRDVRAEIKGEWETAEWAEPAPFNIAPVNSFKARRMFLQRYAELWKNGNN